MNAIFKQSAKTAAVCTLLIGTIGNAYAANPHFVGKVTSTINNVTGAVTLCFKEAGLGDNQRIDYLASATATATYVCRNQGGNCPNAANKTTVTGPVSASKPINSDKNGQVNACITIAPPSAGTFTCPGGQRIVLSSVTYSGLTITDTTNNVTATANPVQPLNRGECPAP